MSDETEVMKAVENTADASHTSEEHLAPAGRVASSGAQGTQNDEASVSHAESTEHTEKKKSVPRARRMKLSLTQVDPWSVTKVSFMLLIAGALIQLIAVIFLYFVLQAAGVFDSLTSIVSSAGLNSSSFDISSFISLGRVISIFTIISVFEIVVGTVLAAIGAFLYNIVSSLVGGIHVTLGDD